METADDLKHFSNNLKALRNARAWPQDELGERVERNPSLDVILRLSRALAVGTAELLGDELTRLDRTTLLARATKELSRHSDEELRTWLRVSRTRLRWLERAFMRQPVSR